MMSTQLALPTHSVPNAWDSLSKGQASGLDTNPAAIYLLGLSPTGRRSMLSKLRHAAVLLGLADPLCVPWHELRFQHLSALRTRLQESGLAPATVNGTLHAVRGVLRAAYNLGLLSGDDYQRLREVKPAPGTRLPAGRALGPDEIRALLEACARDRSPAGARDSALIALLYACGLRRSELVTLNLEDYHRDTGELVVRGKGNRERLVYVNEGAADALADWLDVRGDAPGALFSPVAKGGRMAANRMTDQAVYNALRKRATEAGLKAFSPHDLRRTFVSDLLDAGADVVTVQQLAGHANVQTTARYDRRGEGTKRMTVRLLHVPYQRRSSGSAP